MTSTSKVQRTTGETRQCKLPGCRSQFAVPIAAKNKEFCSAEHRLQWHGQERARALEMLRQAEASQGQGQGAEQLHQEKDASS